MEKSFSLRSVIDIDELQSIQDSFARAVGISSVILSPEGEPLTRFTNPTRFCSLIQSTEKGKERCFRSFMEMGKNALGAQEPEICYCFAHGGHFVAPIVIDGEHMGTMFAGQFIPERFSPGQFQNLEEITHEIDIDPGLLRKEAEKMRVVQEDVIRNYSSLLFKIVESIARRGLQAAEVIRAKDALQRAHDELERRVQERTAELSEANKGLRHEIAERKIAEEALRKSKEKYRNIYNNTQVGLYRSRLSDGKMLMVNNRMSEMFGYDSPEETVADYVASKHYVDATARGKLLNLLREHGKFINFEALITKRDGSKIWIQYSGTLVPEKGYFEGVATDITEQKRAEEALKHRVEFEKIITAISTSFINLAPDEIDIGIEDALGSIGEFAGIDRSYVFRLFDDGTKTDNTHEWCAEGIVPQIENLKGLSVADFPWFLERLNRFETVHIPSLADLPPEADAEKRILQSQDILSAILVPMVYGRTLVGFIGFDSVKQEKGWSYENISLLKMVGEIFVNALERRRVMDALRSSEAKFRTLIEKNPLGAMIIDKDRKIREINDAAATLIGRPREKIIGMMCHEFVSPRAENDCPIYDHGQTIDHKETILLSKDRGEIPIEKTVTGIDIDGEPMLLEMFSDITEHKAAENALRESEEKYRTIYDSSKDAIMTLTSEEGYLSGNPAVVKTFACKGEKDFISRAPHDLSPQYQPDGTLSSEKAKQMMAIAMEKGSYAFEWTHKRMDGKEFPTTVLLTMMKLQGRRVLQATIRDITEQKAAETALRESEENYRNIIENMQDAFYRADMEDNLIMVSPSAARLLNYDSIEEMIGLNVAKTFYAVPEKRDEFLKILEEKGMVNDYEITLKKKDGTLVFVRLNSQFCFDKSGNPLGVEGIFSDITERRAAEEEIKKKADELEKFNKLAVGRELKMIELKKEINALVDDAGEGPRYKIVGDA